MRKTGIWLSALAMVMMAGSASAITADGDWDDWFTYGGNPWADWDQAAAAGSLVNPGIRFQDDSDWDAWGGQEYDIEQIFYIYEDDDINAFTGGKLYIGMVTGYNPNGPDYFGSEFPAGDMFVGLGPDPDFDLAVATDDDEGRFGGTWINDGWSIIDPDPFAENTPYRIDETLGGVIEYGTGLASGLGSTVAWGKGVDGSAHNFLEICIDLNGDMELLIDDGLGAGGLTLHWTMACGNDAIDVIDDVPLAPVPEPTTMVLLGMGVLGMALRARRPVC